MADVESSSSVQQPPSSTSNHMNSNSIPLLTAAELMAENSGMQQQQAQSSSASGVVGHLRSSSGGGSSASSSSTTSSNLVVIETQSSSQSSVVVISGGGGGGSGDGGASAGAITKPDAGEPPSKKQMLDHPSTSSGGGATSLQQEKLEYRLGGILCCAVCLDLPKTAMYQCQMGHLMCAACFTHLLADGRLRDQIATCPNCRVEISKSTASRNLAVEKAASELPSECQYCNKEFPYKSLDRHEQHECQERPTNCKYYRIGCQWRGPNHETTEHERNCLHPTKSGYEVMAALEAHDAKIKDKKKMFCTLIDLLSYEKIIFNDLQMKPYRTDEYVHKLFYETARFSAFNQQWVVKARINNSQRDPHQSNDRTITYQCLTLLNTCTEREIITLEGIGNQLNGYHPLQKRLAKMNGSQCGFCTPGFIMNMYGLLESKNGKVTMDEVENSFGGNICRCTGYRPILDAMKSFALDSNIEIPAECRDIEDLDRKICPKTDQQCGGSCHKPLATLNYDDGTQWCWPKTLTELFEALDKADNDPYMLVAGNTAHGVYRRSEDIRYFIDVNRIAELKAHTKENDKLTLGGNMSLTDAMEAFKDAAKSPGFEYCAQLWHHFDLIANVPVRNSGTLAGNISIKKAHHEFPSDVFITFEALDAQVVVSENATSQKTMSLTEYLKTSTNKIVLTAFELKAYPKDTYIYNSYKIMPRAQNAHAYVNAAFLLEMDMTSNKVNTARICFGGISADFVHATSTEILLTGQDPYDKDTFSKTFSDLMTAMEPDAILPDRSPEYRKTVACGLLYKFLLSNAPNNKVKDEFKTGADILIRPLSSGQQSFETIEKNYPITKPVEKLEAMIQCSGEATYMNDTLTPNNAVYCAFVSATKVGATIEQIDASEALATPGVIAFFSAKDIPGTNEFTKGSLGYDPEEIFCAGTVKYFSQPFGMIVALTSDIANYASTKVNAIYSNADSSVLVDTAAVFEANALDRLTLGSSSLLQKIIFSDKPDITVKGIFEIGLQYHFNMEPQTTIAVPFEEGLQVWSATQWMDHTQCAIAQMLQLRTSHVQLKVRRLGGGFGSKITRCNQVACASSLAAYKLQRPARFVQTIESMMNCNGKRWACRSDYEFHVKFNGKIVGLTNSFVQDAGCTLNENPVPAHSTDCSRNCYQLTDTNFKLDGQAVRTDAPSSCWCRAPGSVEGIAMIENIIEHIAFEANLDPADVRLVNIRPGNKMATLLPRFIKSSEYRERRKEIDEFNEKNRWRKHGLGLAIMEYPIVYFGQFSATVAIYHCDGTVVISHGGIEMGQGMNTKIAQVAAYHLGIPLELVKIESSDTINGANSVVTGAAISSESVCFAVRKSCLTLNGRLKPVKDSLKKDASWQKIVQAAWERSINMIASDHYKHGDMQNYSVFGLALTEIEVDILSGSNQIKRVDILEDTGESLSPYVDIGQVEGAFVMCLGYWLTEQMVYDRQTGQLLTNRTWNYKPPGAKDIPIDFRIELLQKSPNPAGFMRSKATAEPPCCLAVSAIFAVQHAIQSARNDAGVKREYVRLGAPTTPETIVLNSGSDVQTYSLE